MSHEPASSRLVFRPIRRRRAARATVFGVVLAMLGMGGLAWTLSQGAPGPLRISLIQPGPTPTGEQTVAAVPGGSTATTPRASEPSADGPAAVSEVPVQATGPRTVEQILAGLSVDQKLGQLLMFGFSGSRAEDARELIGSYQPGAIVFVQNTKTVPQTQLLTSGLQRLAADAGTGIPLFIAIDEEGGQVQRLTQGVTYFPSMRVLGATYNPDLARLEGEVAGRDLHALGINMNLGPVLDVDTNPSNPVIGARQRSLGADPTVVGSLGQAYIEGLQAQHVLAVAKHFPGHGGTDEDSHLTLPHLPYAEDRLDRTDLVPFKQVAPEVGAMMTAHILFPKIDPTWPSSLSPTFVQHLLREEIGFDGLVMTDDTGAMAAITATYDPGTAAVEAVLAGSDLVMVVGDSTRQRQTFVALQQAVQTGKLPISRVDASVRRILTTKQAYGLLDATDTPGPLPQPDVGALQQIAQAAITLVRDPHHQVPFSRGDGPGLVISSSALPPAVGGTRLGEQVRQRRAGSRELVIRAGTEDRGLVGQALADARTASFVVVATVDAGASQQNLIQQLREAGAHPVVVEFAGPSGVPGIPPDVPYMVAYAPRQELVDAAVEVLFGQIPASGRLPVPAGPYPLGTGQSQPALGEVIAAPWDSATAQEGLRQTPGHRAVGS